MRFWPVLGKIKPRNENSRCILCRDSLTSCFGGVRSFWILELKIWIFHQFGGWSSDRYEGGLNLFYAPETDIGPRWTQTPEKDLFRHILTCFHHFWALFCLKPTRNALFTPFLVQNCQVAVTKQVQIGFSRPGPF